MDFSAQLTSLNNAFKAQFGSIKFSQMLDRKSYEERDSFIEQKMKQVVGDFDESQMQELINQVGVYAPDVYAMSKAHCFVSALEFKNNGLEQGIILGTPQSMSIYSSNGVPISIEYFTGETLEFSTSGSAEDARKYWEDTVKVCNSQFSKPSLLDVDITQFNAGYPENLVNFLVEFNANNQQHTEL